MKTLSKIISIFMFIFIFSGVSASDIEINIESVKSIDKTILSVSLDDTIDTQETRLD
jgi:hypothetical protein